MIITTEVLKTCITFNPLTGVFTHNVRPLEMFTTLRNQRKWNTRYAGKPAGRIRTHKNGKRYAYLGLFNKEHLAHRMAWLYHYGEQATMHVDHINGDGTDNRIVNLRNVSACENSRNMKVFSNSRSGIPGVSRHSQVNKWNVRIQANKVCHQVGLFDSFFDACCARKSAELRMDFHANHGSNRNL